MLYYILLNGKTLCYFGAGNHDDTLVQFTPDRAECEARLRELRSMYPDDEYQACFFETHGTLLYVPE